MIRRFEGRTALVTGGAAGIGRAIAGELLVEGARVLVADRDAAGLTALPEEFETIEIDLAGRDAPGELGRLAEERLGGVDVLVNNAGFGLYGPVEDIGIEEARYQFEVNVVGTARLTQLLLPAMREKRSGTIVNITSMGGKIYTLLGAWYHATKHALEGWSDCLRLELAPFGIRVMIVEPGLIETEFGGVVVSGLLARSGSGAYTKQIQAVAKSTQEAYGHGRGTPPEVIARVVSQSVRAKKPRTRYVAGKYAKPMIRLRVCFGDRMFDRVITSQMR